MASCPQPCPCLTTTTDLHCSFRTEERIRDFRPASESEHAADSRPRVRAHHGCWGWRPLRLRLGIGSFHGFYGNLCGRGVKNFIRRECGNFVARGNSFKSGSYTMKLEHERFGFVRWTQDHIAFPRSSGPQHAENYRHCGRGDNERIAMLHGDRFQSAPVRKHESLLGPVWTRAELIGLMHYAALGEQDACMSALQSVLSYCKRGKMP